MSDSEVKSEPMDTDSIDFEAEILGLCGRYPHGVRDTIVRDSFPNISAKQRMEVINRLIRLKKIDLLSSKNEPGVVIYRLSTNNKASTSSGIGTMDQMERTVYQIIEESGNLGIGLRDLRIKTHLTAILLNKTLRSLQTKELIKGVTSVRENRRKVMKQFSFGRSENEMMF